MGALRPPVDGLRRVAICALRASGLSLRAVAMQCGVSHTTVLRLTNPASAEVARVARRAWQKRQYGTNPAFRAKRIERATRRKQDVTPEQRKRWSLRAHARQEAAETGEPVERVYERWGVA